MSFDPGHAAKLRSSYEPLAEPRVDSTRLDLRAVLTHCPIKLEARRDYSVSLRVPYASAWVEPRVKELDVP